MSVERKFFLRNIEGTSHALLLLARKIFL